MSLVQSVYMGSRIFVLDCLGIFLACCKRLRKLYYSIILIGGYNFIYFTYKLIVASFLFICSYLIAKSIYNNFE